MYYVYVIVSSKNGNRYTGLTQDFDNRLREHNRGETKFTKPYIPYSLLYKEVYSNIGDARNREKYLKSAAGRRFLIKSGILNVKTTDQKPARLDVSQAGLGV